MSRDDVHTVTVIGTMQGMTHCHSCDDFESITGDTHHSVESLSFLWPQIQLCNAMSVLFFIQMSVWRIMVYHSLDMSLGNLGLCFC